MSDAFYSLLNSGRWSHLNKSAVLTVKHHNPENLVFQHLPKKKKINNSFGNNRLEEISRMRNYIIVDTLTSVDIVEIVKCGGIVLEVFLGFFCHNLEFNLFSQIVTETFEKRDSFNSQGKDLLQNLAKISVYQFTVMILEKILTKNMNALLKLE